MKKETKILIYLALAFCGAVLLDVSDFSVTGIFLISTGVISAFCIAIS